MKNILLVIAIISAGLLSGFALTTGCVSKKAVPQALFPAAQLTWPDVEKDYLRGLQDGLEDGVLEAASKAQYELDGARLGVALKERDVFGVKTVPWGTMAPWVERGIQDQIQDQDISIGVAESLREQLKNFTTVITKIQNIN